MIDKLMLAPHNMLFILIIRTSQHYLDTIDWLLEHGILYIQISTHTHMLTPTNFTSYQAVLFPTS